MNLNSESYKRTIYYLPGMGGQLHTGLGVGIRSRGFNVTGRETLGDFRRLTFQDQINIIISDLQKYFWHEEARLIVNSFGAYLYLNAQINMEPFPGNVLILSPIVGGFMNSESQTSYIPPRSERLLNVAISGDFPTPKKSEIHVGANDWQSNPNNVSTFAKATGIDITIVPELGHMLGKDYVGGILDSWL